MLELLHNAKYKAPALPKATPAPRRLPPQTEVAAALRRLRERHGMINAEIQRALSRKLQVSITHSRLHGWFEGREPRRHRAVILESLREIALEQPAVAAVWVLPAVVRADVEAWLSILGEKQLARLAKVSVFTIRAWAQGKHRVRAAKWEAVGVRVGAELRRRSHR
jgi:hypothetical protein